jgi:hypothetical protein
MFCPTCGFEAVEGHKFCKSCGKNLQIVADSIAAGDDTLGQLRGDLDKVKEALASSGKSIADEVRRTVERAKRTSGRRHGRYQWGRGADQLGWDWGNSKGGGTTAAPGSAPTTQELERIQQECSKALPRPKEWLKYSRQHSIRDGLMSLVGGLGTGAVFYFMGRIMLESGAISGIAESSHVHDLDKLLYAILPYLWLFGVVPAAKGLVQIFYGALFAEPISKIAERYGAAMRASLPAPAPPQIEQPFPRAERPKAQDTAPAEKFGSPPSITEHTTNILEKA